MGGRTGPSRRRRVTVRPKRQVKPQKMGHWWKRRQEHYVVPNEEFHINVKRAHCVSSPKKKAVQRETKEHAEVLCVRVRQVKVKKRSEENKRPRK